MKARFLLATAIVLASIGITAELNAQPKRVQTTITNKDWLKPFPGFKIVGNMYYVGTYDLGCYLIDSGDGLILVNTGIMGSYPLMKANIEALGFKTSDIKIITATHGHSDHVADIASFQRDAPNAKTYISERDVESLVSGGNFDYRRPAPNGRGGLVYDPIKVDVKTKPGDHIKLGNVDMTI